jgi:hypothetical protein
MSPSAEGRASLAAQQAALVEALLAGGEAPAGFDEERLRVAGSALARKRAQAVARAWPGLASGLGTRFAERFAAYALTSPLPRHGGPCADGRAFARWLAARGELPDAGRLQALGIDVRYRLTPSGLVARRGPVLRVALLRRPRRLIVAMRLPWLGERWWRLPLGWRGRMECP